MQDSKALKKEILEKVKLYYETTHKEQVEKDFDPKVDRVNYAGRLFDESEMVNLVDSSLDFWLTHGDYSQKFETELATILGVKWSLLVNSGSSANLLAFMALTSPLLKERQVKRGDEVITVAAAFPTTVAPIVQYGAVPVFVDVDFKTANIDVSKMKKALSPKTKAVMLAHSLGNPFNISAVQEFCEKHDLWLIEDNCDALGSLYSGKLTGIFGDIGTSSFYPPHHITMGEGGAVYTDNPLLKKIMMSMRDWGRDCWCPSGVDNSCGSRFVQEFGSLPVGYDHKYVYSHFGYNLKATDMQAAIGLAQLEKLDMFTEKRIKNFNTLYKKLQAVSDYLLLPEKTPNSQPSWFGFLMIVKDSAPFTRNELAQYLEKSRIQTRNLFSGNIIRHPAFETLEINCDYRVIGELTNTDTLMNSALWIGVYPGMNEDKLSYMSDKIIEFVDSSIAAGRK
jgi:CDP-6-deoxy-D-xylo-4-hexulose-3-dehydrase